MVQLGETGGEFAGTGAGSRNHNEGSGCFDVGVSTVAFIGNDGGNICRITFSKGVEVGFDFVIFELAGEIFGFFLAAEESDDDGADIEAAGAEKFDKAENFGFVGNHMVGANFGMFDGIGVDTEDNFSFVFEFLEKSDFEVGEEAGEGAGSVLIVDEFAAEFEVKFVKHFDAFFDFLLLNF